MGAIAPTKDQRRVLDAPGDVLVMAPPGSGKTAVALLLAERACAGLAPDQSVLFLTFSNAAVEAVAGARGKVVPGAAARQFEVTNFHRFALRVLRSYGRAVGLRPPVKVADAALTKHLDESGVENHLGLGFVGFDEFVPLANKVLDANEALRSALASCYPLVIVDEFQDTNDDQWGLIQRVATNGRLVCMCDPDQMIYEFQGASAARVSQLKGERPGLREIHFDASVNPHRFDSPAILDLARCLLERRPAAAWPDAPGEAPWIRQWHKAAQCKCELAKFVHRVRKAGARTTVVLCRHKETVRRVSGWLADPKLGGGLALPLAHYCQPSEAEAQAVSAAARGVCCFADATGTGDLQLLGQALQWLALVPTALASRPGAAGREGDSQRLREVAAQLLQGGGPSARGVGALCDLVRAGRPPEAWSGPELAALLDRIGTVSLFRKYSREIRDRCGNDLEVVLSRVSDRGQDAGRAPLREVVEDVLLEQHVLRSHGPPRRLSVMTIHQAKGREYDAVAVVYEQHRRLGAADAESRIAYTAVSRARKAVLLLPQGGPYKDASSGPGLMVAGG